MQLRAPLNEVARTAPPSFPVWRISPFPRFYILTARYSGAGGSKPARAFHFLEKLQPAMFCLGKSHFGRKTSWLSIQWNLSIQQFELKCLFGAETGKNAPAHFVQDVRI